jgi:class 3 adenylate cyclase
MSRFDDLVFAYTHATDQVERQTVEQHLWGEFGVTEAVFVLDMSQFSLLTQRHGIVYYLSLIRRMQIIVQPLIEQHEGHLMKFEADNCFARFPQVTNAIQAGIQINKVLDAENQTTPDESDIRVTCGIDYGKFLLVHEGEFFGDPVNRASKLGEDLGEPGEILVTSEAMAQINKDQKVEREAVHFSVSGIRLDAYRVIY